MEYSGGGINFELVKEVPRTTALAVVPSMAVAVFGC
jgi:hypothetical protein